MSADADNPATWVTLRGPDKLYFQGQTWIRESALHPIGEPPTMLPVDVMNVVYNTLQFYANQASYIGQRTGGVLKGCPSGPDPTPSEMAVHASLALRLIDRKVLGRE